MADADAVLKVQTELDGEQAVVLVEGDLDPHTAPLLQRSLDTAMDSGKADVVVQMAGLGFMDSSGLRLLIGAHGALGAQGRRLVLRAPSEPVARLLRITALDERIEVEQWP